jgi:uncharacterized protein
MNLSSILQNHSLWSAIIAWGLAQLFKLPLEFLLNKKWTWGIMFSTGGMPSSHSALIVSAAYAIGLHNGFDNPAFTIAAAIAMIVVYDATGVRRQAGLHAQKINAIFQELLKGHPLNQEELREVLGHSPLEALGGVLLGLATSQVMWMIWK